jgi:hypothetical protein
LKNRTSVRLALGYRYLGRRTRGDREEAVIALTGQPTGADADGTVHGIALVDPTTGRVTLAHARLDFTAPVAVPEKGTVRVHNALEAMLARSSPAGGPPPQLDLAPLPPFLPIPMPVIIR